MYYSHRSVITMHITWLKIRDLNLLSYSSGGWSQTLRYQQTGFLPPEGSNGASPPCLLLVSLAPNVHLCLAQWFSTYLML